MVYSCVQLRTAEVRMAGVCSCSCVQLKTLGGAGRGPGGVQGQFGRPLMNTRQAVGVEDGTGEIWASDTAPLLRVYSRG